MKRHDIATEDRCFAIGALTGYLVGLVTGGIGGAIVGATGGALLTTIYFYRDEVK